MNYDKIEHCLLCGSKMVKSRNSDVRWVCENNTYENLSKSLIDHYFNYFIENEDTISKINIINIVPNLWIKKTCHNGYHVQRGLTLDLEQNFSILSLYEKEAEEVIFPGILQCDFPDLTHLMNRINKYLVFL